LAATFDGTTLRLYVNGVQVASRAQSGAINTSNGALSIGGDALYGQNFSGRIDEVRVYNTALSASQIQTDMTTAIDPGSDPVPPTVSMTEPGPGATASHVVPIAATASDNIGVQAVEFFLDSTSIGEDALPPYELDWDSTTASNGAHTLTAVARDASGNRTTSAGVPVTTSNPVFVNETVVPGITAATTIAFLPGGRMLVGELTEKIWVVQPGANQADQNPFLSLPNANQLVGEQGLMDILPDPNFAQNGFYYVYYTRGASGSQNHNGVSRFTASGNGTVAGSEVRLWEDPQVAGVEHHGGALAFGADGKLYITQGDQFSGGQPAQELDNYRGKVLRINKDGSIPSDNPFNDGAGPNREEIWAMGLRNPFRMSVDPVTGRMYIADVGGNVPDSSYEEVNLGARGANYGWPQCEGSCGLPGFTDPLYAYPHSGRDASITGGVVYRGTQFPSEYRGSYFFADYVQNTISRLKFDANGNVSKAIHFWPASGLQDTEEAGDPVKFVEGPDGSLYYVDIGFNDAHTPNPASIRRIRYIAGNQPPTAVVSANPTSGPAPLPVAFSSVGSGDPEGVPVTYSWTFGDGGTSTQANPSHTYQSAGQYTARLTVSDGVNTTVSNSLTIRVGSPPTATILAPGDGSLFRAGDAINYSGSATDPDDGTLPASAFSWTILFHHDSHVHPGGGPFTDTKTGTLQIPLSGHDFEGTTSYEIILTVTDSSGLTASTSVTVIPDKVNLSFDTVPTGLNVEIDGITRRAPFVLDDLKGFQHTISAQAQSSGGTSYTFSSWSDGGAQSHGIVVPNTDQSYVATFQTATGPGGLAAAYSFDEGLGPSATDASGNGNTGAIGNAAWSAAGKFGNALSFNGSNARVTVNDSSSLDLTTAMTLEAWVFPTASGGWRDVIYKGPNDTYYLEGSSDNNAPATGGTFTSPLQGPSALPLNVWSHIAATYDGGTLRLYVNGTQVVSRAVLTQIATSTGALTIGGDATYGQHFAGRIDEVRIYRGALTQSQIQSDMTTPISGTGPPDTQPPTDPTGLTATVVSGSQVNLAWTGSTDNVAVANYRVERCQGATCTNFVQVATPTATTYGDTGLTPATTYRYRVRAADAAGNFSGYTAIQNATTPDTQPPTDPTGLTATAVSQSQINLAWTGSTDNVALLNYRVERCQGATCTNFVQVATPTTTTYNDTGLAAATTYRYRVRAADTSSNLSGYTAIQNATTLDTQAPTDPTGLTATAVSQSQINLAWTGSTDNVALLNYRVERCQGATCTNFVEVATPTATTYSDTGRAPATTYRYRVRAADTSGNLSGYTAIQNATTQGGQDVQPPTDPTGLTATAVSQSQINLAWSGSTDNVALLNYRVERCQGATCTNFVEVATPTATTYSDTGLAAATTYRYRVRAADTSGNLSGYTTIQNATTPDTQAPTDPTGLTATAVSGTQINLAWTGSTDNVALLNYRVERCQGATCTNFVEVATPTGTTYNDTGLTNATTYRYRVRAADTSGNLSGYTAVQNATTPDTQAPTDPTGLTATAVSGSQINLAWTGSTDNVAVLNYPVERCQGAGCTNFVQVATPTATTYGDTGLTPATTYRYRVRAADAAGNLSGYTAIQNATTQSTPSTLVAAYSFNAGSGPTVSDVSGTGNTGTIVNAVWTINGKFGNALTFNGANARVNIPDAPSLRLTNGMTLEAWVNPTTVNRTWRDVIYKPSDNYYLEATSSRNPPSPLAGGSSFGETWGTAALAPNTWTHLAATYDRATLRLYVNGVEVSNRARTQAIPTSTNPLQIGGDSLFGQYFSGSIDEVRVYSSALGAAQVQADMATAITP
jgi:glucose/arabinose dehydrogenase/chitodextrinase